MARPPLQCEVVELHVHLRLRRGEDDDLIRFFEQAGARQRSLALKIALACRWLERTGARRRSNRSRTHYGAERLCV